MPRFFGTPSGVRVGQEFIDRRELAANGVHAPYMAGISGTAVEGADSIVISGGYVDDLDFGDEIIYTGHGGRDPSTGRQVADQSIEASGNAGLITSRVLGLPVRVTRGRHPGNPYAPTKGLRYAGLYQVDSWCVERGRDGFQVVRFRLQRIPEQEPLVLPFAPEPDPAFARSTVTRRIRDTALSRELKKAYDYTCQICGATISGFDDRRYAEGAHVKPIGRPHLGPDSWDNLLCLCPNHHTELDLGGIFITDTMTVVSSGTPSGLGMEIMFLPTHRLETANVRYHRRLWRLSA